MSPNHFSYYRFLCLKSTGNQVESPEDSMFDNVLWSNCLLEIVDSLLAEVECCNLVDSKHISQLFELLT